MSDTPLTPLSEEQLSELEGRAQGPDFTEVLDSDGRGNLRPVQMPRFILVLPSQLRGLIARATPTPEKPSSQADAVREALRGLTEAFAGQPCDCCGNLYREQDGVSEECAALHYPFVEAARVLALTPSPARDNQLPKGDG